MMTPRIHSFAIVFLFALSVAFASAPVNPPSYEKKNVLIVASYRMDHPWTGQFLSAFKKHNERIPAALSYHLLELNALRVNAPETWELLLAPYLEKIKAGKYDMVVALDDIAVSRLLAHHAELPPTLPIIFAGYEQCPPDLKEKYPNVTGVVQQVAPAQTLDIALKLYPNTKHVVVLSDPSAPARAFEDTAKRTITLPQGVVIDYWRMDNTRTLELFDRLSALSDDSLVLLSPWHTIAENDYQSIPSFGVDLSNFTKHPFFASTDAMLGVGALGGVLTQAAEHGRQTSDIVAEVFLRGGAEAVPIAQGRLAPVFDATLFAKEKLSAAALPPDATFVNFPPSIWHKYEEYFWLVALAFLALSGAVVGYGVLKHRSLKAMRRVLELMPGRVSVMNDEEQILFMNGTYSPDAHTAKTLDDIPDIDTAAVRAAVKETLETGNTAQRDYAVGDTKCSITVAKVPHELFGKNAVIWLATDNTELQNAREAALKTANNWNLAAKIAHLTPLRINAKTREVLSDAAQVSKYWPVFDGKALPPAQWIHPDDFPRVLQKTEALRNGEAKTLFDTFRAIDNGHIRTFTICGEYDAANRDIFTGVIQDITEAHATHLREKSLLELWNTVLNALPMPISIKTADGRGGYVQCNRRFAALFGLESKDVIGRTDTELFQSPEDVQKHRERDADVMAAGAQQEYYDTQIDESGALRHYKKIKIPFKNADGSAIIIAIATDITTEYTQNQAMRTVNTQLKLGATLTRCMTYRLNPKTLEIASTINVEPFWPMRDGKPMVAQEWILKEDLPEFERQLNALCSKKSAFEQIRFRTDYFGKRRYYLAHILMQKDDDGTEYLNGATQDITALTEYAESAKETAELWRSIMDALPVRFYVKDAANKMRFVMCNRNNAAYLGTTPDALIGHTAEEFLKDTESAKKFAAQEQEVLKRNKPFISQATVCDAAGIPHEYERYEIPFKIGNGHQLLVHIGFDITTREQNLRRAQLGEAALSGILVKPDFDDALDVIAETAIKLWRCNKVIFAKHKEGHLHFHREKYTAQMAPLSKDIVSTHEDVWDICIPRLEAGEILCYDNLKVARKAAPIYRANPDYPAKSIGIAPIMVNGNLDGIMIVSFHERHQFTDVDRGILHVLSDCAALAVARERNRKTLSNVQEEQQQQLLDRTVLNHCMNRFLEGSYMQVPFKPILEILCRHLGASYCALTRFDTAAKTATPYTEFWVNEDAATPSQTTTFDPDATWRRILRDKKIVVFERMEGDAAASWLAERGAAHETDKPTSAWVAALFQSGEMWGSLTVAYARDATRQFSLRDKSFVLSAMHMLEIFLLREKSRDDLLASLEIQNATNYCLRHMISSENINQVTRNVLESIRLHSGADDVFFMNFNEEKCFCENFQEVVSDKGELRFSATGSKLSFAADEPWYKKLRNHEALLIPNVVETDTQKIFASWSFILHQERPIRAFYAFPIFHKKDLWGSLGLIYDAARAPLPETEIGFLKNAAHFLEILVSRKVADERLVAAMKQAQAADKAKSYFLASMSHEIRTPLNAVIGFCDLLKDANLGESARREYLESVSFAGDSLLQLVNDILDLSKLEAGQMPIQTEATDLGVLCKSVCHIFHLSVEQKNLELLTEIGEMPMLMLDPQRIRQIIFNIVGNAVKFTKRGGIYVTAAFTAYSDKYGELKIAIRDTGMGIAEEDQKRLFTPFVQLSKMRGTNAANNGTGLGLAIVSKLVEKMNGAITLESKVGEGSTFTILLNNIKICSSDDAKSSQKKANAQNGSGNPAKPENVLVVDDVPMNTKILSTMLKRLGVKNVAVSSAKEALEKMKTDTFDWLLTDLVMPEINGAELANIVRQQDTDIRIALVTADTDTIAFDKSQFDTVLTKPVDLNKLYKSLFF